MAIPNIVPRNNNDGETLGTAAKHWSNVYTEDVTLGSSSLLQTLGSVSGAKVDKQQGSENAGKVLQVGPDGVVTLAGGGGHAIVDSIPVPAAAERNVVYLVPSETSINEGGVDVSGLASDIVGLTSRTDVVAQGDKYIRYANGLQLAWDFKNIPANQGSKTYSFPIEFTNVSMASVTPCGVSSGRFICPLSIYNSNNSTYNVAAAGMDGSVVGYDVYFWLLAIGRWK